MATFICKFVDGDKAYYLNWSTVVDAPTTYGMPLDDFCRHYPDEITADRMERVEAKGTSSRLDASVKELVLFNRAGAGGTRLTYDQIVDYFCRNAPIEGQPDRPLLMGIEWLDLDAEDDTSGGP